MDRSTRGITCGDIWDETSSSLRDYENQLDAGYPPIEINPVGLSIGQSHPTVSPHPCFDRCRPSLCATKRELTDRE